MSRTVLAVAGTRPNLVKVAPILRAIDAAPAGARLTSVLVDTGQHYDHALSGALYTDLRLPAPRHRLGVGSGTHAATTAEILRRLEPVLIAERPDVVLVVGDVDSTVAAALTAAKLGIRVAHVEAGLRSFDRRMPEEINRIVTDALADLLFTTEAAANENLRREGRPAAAIHFVGNVMVDSLLWALPLAQASTVRGRLGLAPGQDFALLTVHRAGNVDAAAPLAAILSAAAALAAELPVILPLHPRTRARIRAWQLSAHVREVGEAPAAGRVTVVEPLGYLDFVHLLARARLVLTDSGGVQDETTVLGVPCLTLRDRTERPVTLAGTSTLVGCDAAAILARARAALAGGRAAERTPPPLWDGHAAERIVRVLADRI
jgi:UDP-N-acetylglucosamine 2-epimerase (non-hydrolysing)